MKIHTLILLLLIPFETFSQQRNVNIHSSTSVGAQARYEVIQSTLAAKWTFRVDRVCGQVSQLVSNDEEEVNWSSMVVFSLPKCLADGKNRYQVFTSGLAARHTFLINTETGTTWQVRSFEDKQGNENLAWFQFGR